MIHDSQGRPWPCFIDHPCGCREYKDEEADRSRAERCQAHTFVLIGEALRDLGLRQVRETYGPDTSIEDIIGP